MFFMVRYCSELADIDSEHFRIIFKGAIYNITFVDNIQYENKVLKIRVAKAVR
jgi:head-tail adaptor